MMKIYLSKCDLLNALLILLLISACAQENDPQKAFDSGDYKTSFKLWKSRAEQGDSHAQNYLGIHYYLGLGVDRDIDKAVSWYEQSATAGNAEAQKNLGSIYAFGEMGYRDLENAYIWLHASYKQGNKNAAKMLEEIPVQLSPGRVRKLKQKSMQYVLNNIVNPENDEL